MKDILQHIRGTWASLRRSPTDLYVSAHDPKAGHEQRLVYLPADEDMDRARRTAIEANPKNEAIELRVLPDFADPRSLEEQLHDAHGLLWLPHPYVVPGGKFDEMYGWDSYFIVVGLLRDGLVEAARQMADNHLYEVAHYGKVLNGNRTYYLDRSQPPFLALTVEAVHRATGDDAWLARALPLLEQDHTYWTTNEILDGRRPTGHGLSRYWSTLDTPCVEAVYFEKEETGEDHHYARVARFFREAEEREPGDFDRVFDRASNTLTPAFYVSDRAMRESGFDPTDRFGRFASECADYLPICLNSLLVQMESAMARLMRVRGQDDRARWYETQAAMTTRRIEDLLWDDELGLYVDYHVREGRRSSYPFVTAFYPLWAGVASQDRARRLVEALPIFERAGGLSCSDRRTGQQWDAPFGWAPMHWIACEGLRRYGFDEHADRISEKFLSLIHDEYERTGHLVEKYDVEARRSDVGDALEYGYASNEIGFGWTNGVYVDLLAKLRGRE